MPYFPCVINASVMPGLGRARSSGLSRDLDPSVPVAEVTLLRECWHRVSCWAPGHWELLCDVPPPMSLQKSPSRTLHSLAEPGECEEHPQKQQSPPFFRLILKIAVSSRDHLAATLNLSTISWSFYLPHPYPPQKKIMSFYCKCC